MCARLGFFIDKITNSIEQVTTGMVFRTDIIPVAGEEIKRVHKKDGWSFNWKSEYKNLAHQLYKLVLEGGTEIRGLISLEPKTEQLYIEMHLIESAPHNQGGRKQFAGVAANMVAFACKMSFDSGFDGFVAFTAKTKLVNHYIETLGAQLIYGYNRMGIDQVPTRDRQNKVRGSGSGCIFRWCWKYNKCFGILWLYNNAGSRNIW
jgi:hypothetical protein